MTTLQIRIKEDTKQEAKKILDTLGMDMSGAITIFLRQVILQKGIPFPIMTENGFSHEFEQQVLDAEKDTESSVGFTNGDDAIAYLHKESATVSE